MKEGNVLDNPPITWKNVNLILARAYDCDFVNKPIRVFPQTPALIWMQLNKVHFSNVKALDFVCVLLPCCEIIMEPLVQWQIVRTSFIT